MEKQKNTPTGHGRSIPQLRFLEFKGEWEKNYFDRLFSFKTTNSFSREQLTYDAGVVKNIHYGDVHTKFQTLFDIRKELVPYININIPLHKISEDNYCKEGDVIFADASEDLNDVGKSIEIVNLDNQKVLSGLHTILARPNRNAFKIGFVGYLMKSSHVRTQIQKEAQGTKVFSISSNRLSKISILFPTLPEQQKIASFFTAIDQKISQLKRKKTLLEQYKKGVMQLLFDVKTDGRPSLRFKDDNGQEFPKWEKKRLGDLIIESNEKSVKSNQYEVISSTKEGLFLQREYFNKDIASIDNAGYKILRLNQLVFSPQNLWLGNININDVFEIGIVSPSYKIFDFNTVVTISRFCKYFLKTPKMMYEYMMASEQGASIVRRNLDIASFYEIIVRIPNLDEQTKIASFLSAIDDKINHTQKQIEKAEVWKKSLLQKMFV